MNNRYEIVRKFMPGVVFSVNCMNPSGRIVMKNQVEVSVGEKNDYEDVSLCWLELHVSTRAVSLDDDENESEDVVFKLDIFYSANVAVGKDVGDDELHDILHRAVPCELFPSVKGMMWQVTREAGFPYMIPDLEIDNLEMVDDGGTPYFDGISQEEKNLKKAWEDLVETYYESPEYKIYYRFFNPVEYNHSDSSAILSDNRIWDMLYQVLFGSFKTVCELRDVDGDKPELVISNKEFSEKALSEFTVMDALNLFMYMMRKDFLIIPDGMCPKRYKVAPPSQKKHIGLLKKEDYLDMFAETDNARVTKKLEEMYEKICECDMQSLLYGS